MGFEIRKVPADWEHPKDEKGHYISLNDDFNRDVRAWIEDFYEAKNDPHPHTSPLEYVGDPPDPKMYMWPEGERTHYMAYQNTSEGTPLPTSKVRKTEDEAWADVDLYRREIQGCGEWPFKGWAETEAEREYQDFMRSLWKKYS